ncbi:MAG: hypothetical protein A3B68_00905 [Candidatus Melainabacteria bacterium RIFCSPHIGHO2_02_FULL_34_12]|nr:MAG: hypothetical protein A3B68_00905 [Candidatus Melainabacteria bacterium RIFCSPHIGHO2_02_FULL_34_12]
MIIELVSFAFKNGDSPNCNYLIDVRFLNNPYYVQELKPLCGLDKDVIGFFKDNRDAQQFLKELYKWITYIIEANKKAKKEKIIIAIGCTGGQHRSPYIAECLGNHIVKKKLVSELTIYHTLLKKYNVAVTT